MERLFGEKIMNEEARDIAYAIFFLFAIGFVALLVVETESHVLKF